jgi:hypothetical protein
VAKADSDIVKWQEDVPEEDYIAAQSYLSLVISPTNVGKIVAQLRAAPIEKYKATDLFRASKVQLPENDDRPCRKEMKKIHKGEALTPVLLVRDPAHSTVIIADGYHRICAAFRIDPDVILDCKIA